MAELAWTEGYTLGPVTWAISPAHRAWRGEALAAARLLRAPILAVADRVIS